MLVERRGLLSKYLRGRRFQHCRHGIARRCRHAPRGRYAREFHTFHLFVMGDMNPEMIRVLVHPPGRFSCTVPLIDCRVRASPSKTPPYRIAPVASARNLAPILIVSDSRDR